MKMLKVLTFFVAISRLSYALNIGPGGGCMGRPASNTVTCMDLSMDDCRVDSKCQWLNEDTSNWNNTGMCVSTGRCNQADLKKGWNENCRTAKNAAACTSTKAKELGPGRQSSGCSWEENDEDCNRNRYEAQCSVRHWCQWEDAPPPISDDGYHCDNLGECNGTARECHTYIEESKCKGDGLLKYGCDWTSKDEQNMQCPGKGYNECAARRQCHWTSGAGPVREPLCTSDDLMQNFYYKPVPGSATNEINNLIGVMTCGFPVQLAFNNGIWGEAGEVGTFCECMSKFPMAKRHEFLNKKCYFGNYNDWGNWFQNSNNSAGSLANTKSVTEWAKGFMNADGAMDPDGIPLAYQVIEACTGWPNSTEECEAGATPPCYAPLDGAPPVTCAGSPPWPETVAGTITTAPCEGKCYEGNMARMCGADGEWDTTDQTGCLRNKEDPDCQTTVECQAHTAWDTCTQDETSGMHGEGCDWQGELKSGTCVDYDDPHCEMAGTKRNACGQRSGCIFDNLEKKCVPDIPRYHPCSEATNKNKCGKVKNHTCKWRNQWKTCKTRRWGKADGDGYCFKTEPSSVTAQDADRWDAYDNNQAGCESAGGSFEPSFPAGLDARERPLAGKQMKNAANKSVKDCQVRIPGDVGECVEASVAPDCEFIKHKTTCTLWPHCLYHPQHATDGTSCRRSDEPFACFGATPQACKSASDKCETAKWLIITKRASCYDKGWKPVAPECSGIAKRDCKKKAKPWDDDKQAYGEAVIAKNVCKWNKKGGSNGKGACELQTPDIYALSPI